MIINELQWYKLRTMDRARFKSSSGKGGGQTQGQTQGKAQSKGVSLSADANGKYTVGKDANGKYSVGGKESVDGQGNYSNKGAVDAHNGAKSPSEFAAQQAAKSNPFAVGAHVGEKGTQFTNQMQGQLDGPTGIKSNEMDGAKGTLGGKASRTNPLGILNDAPFQNNSQLVAGARFINPLTPILDFAKNFRSNDGDIKSAAKETLNNTISDFRQAFTPEVTNTEKASSVSRADLHDTLMNAVNKANAETWNNPTVFGLSKAPAAPTIADSTENLDTAKTDISNPAVSKAVNESPATSEDSTPGSVIGHNDYTPGTPGTVDNGGKENSVKGITTGNTYNGGSVDNGSLASGGSGSLKPPSRDSESLGFSTFNPNEANYDQDNWNRGMETQSSGLVSDEECKHFARRAFAEDHPSWGKVRKIIIERLG